MRLNLLPPQPKLTVVPSSLREASIFIRRHHRHHKPPRGQKFAIAVADESGIVRGVAVVGRPNARHLDNGFVAEVLRLATDECPNACSCLYAACWRACRAMGYLRMITYILKDEPGTSLLAAGARCIGEAGGGSWSRQSRPRVDEHPLQLKLRWEWEDVA